MLSRLRGHSREACASQEPLRLLRPSTLPLPSPRSPLASRQHRVDDVPHHQGIAGGNSDPMFPQRGEGIHSAATPARENISSPPSSGTTTTSPLALAFCRRSKLSHTTFQLPRVRPWNIRCCVVRRSWRARLRSVAARARGGGVPRSCRSA